MDEISRSLILWHHDLVLQDPGPRPESLRVEEGQIWYLPSYHITRGTDIFDWHKRTREGQLDRRSEREFYSQDILKGRRPSIIVSLRPVTWESVRVAWWSYILRFITWRRRTRGTASAREAYSARLRCWIFMELTATTDLRSRASNALQSVILEHPIYSVRLSRSDSEPQRSTKVRTFSAPESCNFPCNCKTSRGILKKTGK
jgi:hypothetical protein